MFADYHVHSNFSDDSTEKMETMVATAIARGLDELCFTDHVDYGIKYDWEAYQQLPSDVRKVSHRNVNYPAYFQEIADLQERFQGQIRIKRGLEFGAQTHTLQNFQTLADAYPMDFIILSCHQVEDQEFWNGTFQQGRTQDDYCMRYFEEIDACIQQFDRYSVLGHLDMIQRYTQPRYPFEKSVGILTKILKRVIADGKGIEVNTSSFYYKLPDLMPEYKILKLYHDLGGKIITVGSDSHTAARLSANILDVYAVLKEIGFQSICTFESMTPLFHRIP